MLLSRVWFLVLAVAAVLGLSTALVARGFINREQLAHVDEQLRRDRKLAVLDAADVEDVLGELVAAQPEQVEHLVLAVGGGRIGRRELVDPRREAGIPALGLVPQRVLPAAPMGCAAPHARP